MALFWGPLILSFQGASMHFVLMPCGVTGLHYSALQSILVRGGRREYMYEHPSEQLCPSTHLTPRGDKPQACPSTAHGAVPARAYRLFPVNKMCVLCLRGSVCMSWLGVRVRVMPVWLLVCMSWLGVLVRVMPVWLLVCTGESGAQLAVRPESGRGGQERWEARAA